MLLLLHCFDRHCHWDPPAPPTAPFFCKESDLGDKEVTSQKLSASLLVFMVTGFHWGMNLKCPGGGCLWKVFAFFFKGGCVQCVSHTSTTEIIFSQQLGHRQKKKGLDQYSLSFLSEEVTLTVVLLYLLPAAAEQSMKWWQAWWPSVSVPQNRRQRTKEWRSSCSTLNWINRILYRCVCVNECVCVSECNGW